MNKLDMAHEYLLKLMETNPKLNAKYATEFVWEMVDAMQAEADKRKPIPKLPALQQTFIDGVEQPRYAPSCDEWQPDWSQAPEWADWWCLSVMHGAMWFSREPICTKATWAVLNDVKFCAASFDEAPPFNYAGNWQESLRKRP